MIPDSEPVPVPDRVLLPAPDGRDERGFLAWWELSGIDGVTVRARPNQVDIGFGYEDPDRIERDALAALAAVRWARRQQ